MKLKVVEHRGRALVPFAVVAAAALVTLLLPPFADESYDWWAAGVGLLVSAGVVAALVTIPSDHWGAGVAALLFLAVVGLARDASGGESSWMTPLILLPVLWIVLYGTAVQLRLAAVGTGLVLVVPVIVVGAPRYELSEWRRAAVWVLLIAVICPTLQRVVRRLEHSMREQQRQAAQLTAVLRAATEHAIIATDLTGTITLFSEGAERMLKHRAADVVGTSTPIVFHDQTSLTARAFELHVRPDFEGMTSQVPQGESLTYTAIYRRGDGSTFPVQLTVTRLLGNDGEHIGWIKIARDITEQEAARHQLVAAERRWRAMLDHLPDVSVLVVGADLRYRVAAGAGLQHQGWPTSLVGLTAAQSSNTENTAILEPLFQQALAGVAGHAELISSRTQVVTDVVAVPLPGDAQDPEVLVLARDMTAIRRREQQLRAARDQSRQLFDEAPHGAVLISGEGIVGQINPALGILAGVAPPDVVGHQLADGPLSDLLSPGELQGLLEGNSAKMTAERTLHTSLGAVVSAEVTAVLLSTADGPSRSLLLTVVDVSERKRFEQQLAHLAEHDPLTGLANRRKFDSELAGHLERCRRYGAQGAVIMLDLDNFKQINDTLGHGAGDQLIISVASVLRQRLRTSDVIARLGGDEFAILLPVLDRAGAETVAADLVQLIRNTVSVLDGSRPRTITASLGLVLIQDPNMTASELLSTVDMTMYDAKDAGRDRYVVHDTTEYPVPRSGARIAWVGRIETALHNDGFRIHAQPILDVPAGEVTGAELLIRMIDDQGNLIMPGRFLYIAERTSLILGIDSYMLTQAAQVLGMLREIHPSFTISVNLSGRNVGHPAISALIPQLINQYNFNPNNLILEITETAAVANIETARTFAEHLRGLGCRFALDDFGAGFGSFYYLKHLVFDYIKIDGEFVQKSPSNPADRLIITSIVDIARGLGKTTVAEFVSDPAILTTITALGVDRAQGYHIGRPTPVEHLINQLTATAGNRT